MKRFKAILFLTLIAGFGLSAWIVYHNRPLVRSDSWSATIQASGQEELVGEVYEMLGQRNKLFVRLPAPVPEHLSGYPWLSFDPNLEFVAVPNWPGEEPYLNFNHDMAMCVFLTDPKVDGDWDVSWSSTGFEARDSHRIVKLVRLDSANRKNPEPNNAQHHKSDRAGESEA